MSAFVRELKRLHKKALPGPWEAVIDDDNEMVCQVVCGGLKPFLGLAQFSTKENEIRLICLLRNHLPEIIKALEKEAGK